MSLLRRLVPLLALTLVIACGDDDDSGTNPPPEDAVLDVPGEVATLALALEQAASGDSIRLAPGDYTLDSALTIDSELAGVTLIGSDSGERPSLLFPMASGQTAIAVAPGADGFGIVNLRLEGTFSVGVRLEARDSFLQNCRIDAATAFSVECRNDVPGRRIERNLLIDAGIFGLRCEGGASPDVIGNTISGAGDCGIYTTGASPDCRQNLVIDSTQWGVAVFGSSLPELSCNNITESGIADYNDIDVAGKDDIHMDPLFCDEESFGLSPDSPCAAGNAKTCGQIGAVGVLCE